MKISTLIQNINAQLAGELLSLPELTVFIDKAIDDINTRLNTKFPVMSDLIYSQQQQKDWFTTIEYTAIPDNYMRTVVVPGAVFKYYITDEEGAAVAPKYEEEFLKGLFYMERDYISNIPEMYQASDTQGYVGYPFTDKTSEGGLSIDTSVFQL